MTSIKRITLLAGLLLAAANAGAQDFPSRPIRLIVPSPAGQGSDTTARVVANKVTEQTGYTIVVDNKPGGNMIIGAQLAATSKPDGYTILMSATTVTSAAGSLQAKVPYDVTGSFTPIMGIALNSYLLVVRSDMPVNNVADVIALAKQKPGALTFGSGSQSTRLAGELFKLMAGIDMLNVPYQGTPQALQDLAAGRVHMMFNGTLTSRPLVDAGKLKALGISAPERDPGYPNAPPISDTLKGYNFVGYMALVAPAGTPRPLIQTLNRVFTNAMNAADVKKQWAAWGLIHWPVPPEEVSKFITDDLARWRALVKEAKIPMEGQ